MTSWTDMLDRFWDSSIDLIILINLSICILHRDYLVGIMRLGQAEQNCTLCLHIISCLYCAVQLPGTSLASVLSTNHRRASWTASTNHIAPNLLKHSERSQIIVGRCKQIYGNKRRFGLPGNMNTFEKQEHICFSNHLM
jgi:hypothetical protein